MEVTERSQHEGPHSEADVVVVKASEAISTFLREYLGALSARASATTTAQRHGKIEAALVESKRQLVVLGPIARSIPDLESRQRLIRNLTEIMYIEGINTMRREADEFVAWLEAAPRATRRAREKDARQVLRWRDRMEEIFEMFVDLVEELDPAPDDYLEQEMMRIHGSSGAAILDSFRSIAESEEFTLDAFKKRHDIKS